MKASSNVIKLIKEFEGNHLTAYYDEVGVITIGYGITNADKSITGVTIKKGMKITQETADKWLEDALNKIYAPKVMKYDSKYQWNQNEFDALLSFTFNIGSIDQLTSNGTRTREKIASKMLEYNKADGKVYNGLVRRRKAEHELFLTPVKEEKKEDDFVPDKNKKYFTKVKSSNTKGITDFLHNRGYGAGEHNLGLIAQENCTHPEVKKLFFELAKKGQLAKPEGLNKWDK